MNSTFNQDTMAMGVGINHVTKGVPLLAIAFAWESLSMMCEILSLWAMRLMLRALFVANSIAPLS
jgi:hypothetical protein